MARFGQTETQVKTNFTLGNDSRLYSSTYDRDFNPHVMRRKENMKLLSTYSKLYTRVPNRISQEDVLPTMSKKTPRSQPTHITFGNDDDPCGGCTAYQEFNSTLQVPYPRRRPFPPPQEAMILPNIETNQPSHSSVNRDYRFFGNNLNRSVYQGRVGDLQKNNQCHNYDSVANTLLGRRRKMLTVSMMDYKNPLDRVKGNIKYLMVHEISPSVRKDSVWLKDAQQGTVNKSNNKCDDGKSENKVNFSWPDKEKGMKLFYNPKTR